MDKIYYVPKKVLVKPIHRPKKIDVFNHLIIFVNKKESTIEVAVPDFEERYFDSDSSNVSKIKKGTEMRFFEVVKENDPLSRVPIYELVVFDGTEKDPTKYTGIKVISSSCINGFSTSLEDLMTIRKPMMKVKR